MAVILLKKTMTYGSIRALSNVQDVSELLKPYDASQMRCYPVSNRVKSGAER